MADAGGQPCSVYLLAALAAVGGFLFGYDTGVISGAMAVILEEEGGLLAGLGRAERDLWHQAIVASTIGTAAVFALLSGPPSQLLGRASHEDSRNDHNHGEGPLPLLRAFS